jgi:hypothetical protein
VAADIDMLRGMSSWLVEHYYPKHPPQSDFMPMSAYLWPVPEKPGRIQVSWRSDESARDAFFRVLNLNMEQRAE